MKRSVQMMALVSCAALAGSASASLTVQNDYDLTSLPGDFTNAGGVTFSAAGAAFDGGASSTLTAASSDVFNGTPATNYIFEVVTTPSDVSFTFDIISSLAPNAGNAGLFIFRQDLGGGDTYNGIEASEQAFAGSTTPVVGTEVTLSYVVEDIDGSTANARLFVDGVEEVSVVIDTSGVSTYDIAVNTEAILGSNVNDNPLGNYNGTIRRARYSTFTLGAGEFFGSDAGNDNLLTVVPEPGSLALLGLGGLLAARRRR